MEAELDAAAAAAPNPGRTEPFHRMNRAEYQNAVRDLLAFDLGVADDLPADDASYGFDNMAGVLRMSPTLFFSMLGARTGRGRREKRHIGSNRMDPKTDVDSSESEQAVDLHDERAVLELGKPGRQRVALLAVHDEDFASRLIFPPQSEIRSE